MVIGFTTSTVAPEQDREVEAFLGEFLPRLKGRVAGGRGGLSLHEARQGEEVTAIIWSNEDAEVAYRESELIKEALALEQRLGLASRREAYPLTLALS
jgi:heme-degrading monooxygenase HmoA